MILTIAEILLINKSLTSLNTSVLNGALSYRIKKTKDLVAPICKNFEETKNDLIRTKYPTPTENNSVRVSDEDMPKFMAEVNTLLAQEEELNITKFKLSDFNDAKVAPEFFDFMEKLIDVD